MPPSTHSPLGASGAYRWLNCTPSARHTEAMEDEETTFAAEGSAAHELAEWKVRKALKMRAGRRPSSDYWTDEMEETTGDYRDKIVDLYNEAKLSCPDPIAMVEQHLDFSCYVEGGFGTGDFLLVYAGKLIIGDFKYGRGVPVSAEQNPQMMLYALGALQMFDMLYDIDEITMFIFQPRIQNYSEWTISAADLYKWAEEYLRPRAEMAFKGEGEFTPGSWCRFCKARNTCRARAESFLELAKMEFKPPASLTDDEMSEVMEKADALSKWAGDVMAYASAEAIEHGKKWPNWKVVAGRATRRFTDEAAVEKAAKAAGYSDIYNHSLITLTSFEKLMGKDIFQEVLGKYVTKPAGKLTLVRADDPRPEVVTDSSAENEFND